MFIKNVHQKPHPFIMADYLKQHFPAAKYKAAYEAGKFGFWIQRQFTQLGIECLVVNPADIPKSQKDTLQKTDPRDAPNIGLRLQSGVLHSIYIPDEQQEADRVFFRHIELFLNYCVRFNDRQFITRDKVHKGILERFENLLNEYFQSEKPQTIGLPSVAYCASELYLSANYFGDLVKKETGKTAQEYIQSKVIDVAKEKIFDQSKSVSQIAHELGFKYPQHFTRLFKQRVGQSPNEYRMLN